MSNLVLSDENADNKSNELILKFKEKTKKEPIPVHAKFTEKLYQHQRKGVQFMWQNTIKFNGGCILAHDMGVGRFSFLISHSQLRRKRLKY